MAVPFKYSVEEAQTIREEYDAGETLSALSAKYDGSVTAIKSAIRRAGGTIRLENDTAKMRRSRFLFSEEQERAIREEYEAGATTKQLADKYNVSTDLIRRSVVRAGGTMQTVADARRGRPCLAARKLTEEQEQAIREEYEAGANTGDLAAKWGVSPCLIRDAVVRAGGTLRTTGGRSVPVGTRRLNSDGYVVVRVATDDPMRAMAPMNYGRRTCWVKEHRLVMARHLGRPLLSHEQPHHRNTDRTDNRIENLELRIGNHGAGGNVHDLLADGLDVDTIGRAFVLGVLAKAAA